MTSSLKTYALSGFHDDRCPESVWKELQQRGGTNTVYQTKRWLQAWWETLGDGQLRLIVAERAGRIITLAPLFELEGMYFLLGAGESDYLDFIGETSDPEVLAAILTTAIEFSGKCVGFRFHLVPDRSPTSASLPTSAKLLGWQLFREAELPAIEIDLTLNDTSVRSAVNRGMLRREKYCQRNGNLVIHKLRDVAAIRPHLKAFYAQHKARWQAKGIASQFENPRQQAFLERFLEMAADTSWARFIRIDWNDHPIAFELAWHYQGTYYPAPWSFDIEFAKQSPGQILLRHSILNALDEKLTRYDLGGGDQEYKLRLPHQVHLCGTWGIYPP